MIILTKIVDIKQYAQYTEIFSYGNDRRHFFFFNHIKILKEVDDLKWVSFWTSSLLKVINKIFNLIAVTHYFNCMIPEHFTGKYF